MNRTKNLADAILLIRVHKNNLQLYTFALYIVHTPLSNSKVFALLLSFLVYLQCISF